MNLGFSEMLFIVMLALIIFGPKRLPEIGRQIGKALAEFKRASNEFKYQLESEMRQLETEAQDAKGTGGTSEDSVAGGIGRAVAEIQRVTGEVRTRFHDGLRQLEDETNAIASPPAAPNVAENPADNPAPARPAPPAGTTSREAKGADA